MAVEVSDHYREALRRGHVAVVKGRPREAIGHYEQAARLAEGRALPMVSLGSLYLQMRRPKDAARAFDEALRRAPHDVTAMRGKASALQAEGHGSEAVALLRRADELEAMERAGRGRRAVDMRRLELERLVAEGQEARTAGDLDRAAGSFGSAARGFAEGDSFEAAIEACLRALEARPGAIDVHFTMAYLYLKRGWAELGVERVKLIERRLRIDEDPRRRAALLAMARDYQSLAPDLAALALGSA
jgi:tetratricopeptide (TPR) repeat protein